jgi:hypothetical protein
MEASVDLRLEPRDEQRLAEAVERLEHHGLAMTIANQVGMPVEALMRRLPGPAQRAVQNAVNRALEKCLHVALTGFSGSSGKTPSNRTHKALAGAAGAAGGFFGLAGLAFELPVSTTVMLHSIAEIARSHGEDLSNPENALGCLAVFALGSGAARSVSSADRATNTLESAYYATRAALAQATRDAAAYVAQKGATKGGAPVLVRFLSNIASRFGVEVAEKVTAQMVPIIGAAGGLALNVAFTAHFQRVAEGHYVVRELERRYGHELVQREYQRLRLMGR